MKKLLLLSLLALLALGVRSQSADKPGNWKLIASDEYPAEDVGVATYTVTTDFNADPTGVKNSLDAFQTALTKLGENRRGGVLFVPAGRYRISGKLFIPTGVTMRVLYSLVGFILPLTCRRKVDLRQNPVHLSRWNRLLH